ncbi:MAG: hypothetical protein PHF24_08310 [Syntrophomonas sp.]|nr:hypothetical protein [Syntrophomonas sp.]
MFTGLQIKFLILSVVILIITIGFALLIGYQMNKVHKIALVAKQQEMEIESQILSTDEEKP